MMRARHIVRLLAAATERWRDREERRERLADVWLLRRRKIRFPHRFAHKEEGGERRTEQSVFLKITTSNEVVTRRPL
jgi:hypothetical protein